MSATKVGISVKCCTCGRSKSPRGRSLPPEISMSYCGSACPGYRDAPLPGDLFPGETDEDFGYSCSDNSTRPVTPEAS